MDIEDLRKFLAVAELNNLQSASAELNQTPGALSKVIKRLEQRLNTQLFDRVGRNIELNLKGEKFRQYARHLVHESDQALSEFNGDSRTQTISIAGPSVLLQHWLPEMITRLDNSSFEFNISSVWEGDAVTRLANGKADLALVTDLANDSSNPDVQKIDLGKTQFKVVAADCHPVWELGGDTGIDSNSLRRFPFACPSVSPFCGIQRGIGSDGWRDDKVPRTIGFRCNDYSVLQALVREGRALAYVPDFVARDNGLRILDVTDCDYICEERICLLYNPSLAYGWVNRFVAAMGAHA